MTAPAIIHDLVQRFRDSRELYRSGRYNEAQLRQEFLNPLFETLGWDMFNRSNFAPQYREVIHEDSLEDEGSLKAPDYAFRIGTTRKFFVEAKKPAVDIRYAIHPAYQLRRYAWNAHLPLSILTDFEELAVYDCRTRPDPKDSAATGRVMLFTFEDYLTRWNEIAQIFSREAVWNGSFDRYAEGSKGKRGTTEVDAEFLKEIEQWRLLLARNIALRNFRSAANPAETPPNLHRAERQLNYAVQTTIDRILFLRICEDRQIEPTDQLLQIAEGSDIYAQLLKLFQKADQKYNSGLFHFNNEKGQTSEPDRFTPTLQIDDKVLRQVIKSTYYPCPYMFNEIPVEILGQVYEQFLGSVIRLTPGGQAKVEEKPEVRKAGGVYYTPRYIVDYIVENTLGRLLGVSKPVGETVAGLPANEVQPSFQVPHPPSAGLRPSSPIPLRGSSTLRPKEGLEGVGSNRSLSGETSTNINSQQSGLTSLTPSSVAVGGGSGGGSFNQLQQDPSITPVQALSLRVVDPACGSGSFLLGAYQYLLDWHLNYYLNHDPQSHSRGKNPPLVATEGGEYRLTTETKKRILTSNIYGVDIDAQAVEVTKLSLLLKLLEGETGQLALGFERVLPDLGQNIRCGNSLIGWDYFQGQMFPDEEEIHRINPFDWQRAFPHVFAAGGFDAVIGNPPYVRSAGLEESRRYYSQLFQTAQGAYDIYIVFIERTINLLRKDGFAGLITPNKYFVADYGKNLRNLLLTKVNLVSLVDMGKAKSVFQDASVATVITIFRNSSPTESVEVLILNDDSLSQLNTIPRNIVNKEVLIAKNGTIQVYNTRFTSSLLEKIYSISSTLDKVADVRTGIMGFDYWALDKYIDDSNRGMRIATNSYIDQYRFLWGKKVNLYKRNVYDPRLDPACSLINENTWEFFKSQKLVIRGVARRLTATYDEEGVGLLVAVHGVYNFQFSPYFLLGLLNSKLFNWLHLQQFYSARIPEGSLRYPVSFLKNLPIIKEEYLHNISTTKYEEIVTCGLILHNILKIGPLDPREERMRSGRVKYLQGRIDDAIFSLYDLNQAEVDEILRESQT